MDNYGGSGYQGGRKHSTGSRYDPARSGFQSQSGDTYQGDNNFNQGGYQGNMTSGSGGYGDDYTGGGLGGTQSGGRYEGSAGYGGRYDGNAGYGDRDKSYGGSGSGGRDYDNDNDFRGQDQGSYDQSSYQGDNDYGNQSGQRYGGRKNQPQSGEKGGLLNKAKDIYHDIKGSGNSGGRDGGMF